MINAMFGGDARLTGNDTDYNRCHSCGLITTTLPVGISHEEVCVECAEKEEFVTVTRMMECIFVEDSES